MQLYASIILPMQFTEAAGWGPWKLNANNNERAVRSQSLLQRPPVHRLRDPGREEVVRHALFILCLKVKPF